eukprot:1162143-Pelagomonas_calceolata.AAC.25
MACIAQGWDVVQTIDALIRKSGCESRPNAALRNSLQVVRYQGGAQIVCSGRRADGFQPKVLHGVSVASFSEWLQMKQREGLKLGIPRGTLYWTQMKVNFAA